MAMQAKDELREIFADMLNYQGRTLFEPIDPATYRTPEGDTLLHIAAIRGNTRAIVLLLDLGLDINAKGDMGNTALHYAQQHKHPAAYAELFSRGANEKIKNEFGDYPNKPTVEES